MNVGDEVTLVQMLDADRSTGHMHRATVIAVRETDFAAEVVKDDPNHAGAKTLRDFADEGRTWIHGWDDSPALRTVAALLGTA